MKRATATALATIASDNVLLTPHCAGHSDGNAERAAAMFLANLARWCRGEPLSSVAG